MEVYRFLEKDGILVQIDGQDVILACKYVNENHIVSSNIIKKLKLVDGFKCTLVHADPIDDNPDAGLFIASMKKYNVIFDGEKFIPDENKPNAEFAVIVEKE